MATDELTPELRTVRALFDGESVYTVPIYQRNYAWAAEQIEQLITDVLDSIDDGRESYFLGNLVVTRRPGRGEDFEVIDGQQRLTTLSLLLSALQDAGAVGVHNDRLRYEARPNSTEALKRVMRHSTTPSVLDASQEARDDTGIHEAFNVIRQFINQHEKLRGERRAGFLEYLLECVTVVRVTLPSDTDLNRYFEVMNTRGEQLKQVDIVKARLMSVLADDAERECFAWLWNACSDMESYVQMSLTPGETGGRAKLFGSSWDVLQYSRFAELVESRARDSAGATSVQAGAFTLEGALREYATRGGAAQQEDGENERFRSIIEFPAFLLHALRIFRGGDDAAARTDDADSQLDDKHLIRLFDRRFPTQGAGSAEAVREFALHLVRSRHYFDQFVLKRQYTASNGEDGDWSLRRLVRARSGGNPRPAYPATFDRARAEDGLLESEDFTDVTLDVLRLESMLRITYTSPRTMHWITDVLRLAGERQGALEGDELVGLLRRFARTRVKEAFFSGELQPEGFHIPRIVFTYLDYLLADGGPSEFRFVFRTSIEHFYPQSPDEHQTGARVSESHLNKLGNLALVSVSANSKFSNSLPNAKADNFQGTIVAQSPKLALMAEHTLADGNQWDDAAVQQHHDAMVGLLRDDLSSDQ